MSESRKQLENALADGPFPGDVTRAVFQHLISLKAAGVTELPKSDGIVEFPGLIHETKTEYEGPSTSVGNRAQPAISSTSTIETSEHKEPADSGKLFSPSLSQTIFENTPSYGPTVDTAERPAQLQIVQDQVAACTACGELASTRTQTVFGVGTSSPRLVFVGEAPGADEDRLGEPFVGAAGQLLTKIIGAMGLGRDDVYILNTLKCRPPGNRNPKEEELRNCCQFAERQLEILQPEFICCLGSIAAKTLLNSKQSIGRMRGTFYRWRGSQVLVTYHPAYLLRTPNAKRLVWDDMKLLMHEMGLKT